MKKKELLAIRCPRATTAMLRLAVEDKKENRTGYRYGKELYQRQLYLRCTLQEHLLQVALFLPDYMRAGARAPAYRLFVDTVQRKFLTYDMAAQKWRSSKIDTLLDSGYTCYEVSQNSTWITSRDNTLLQTALQSVRGGYLGILQYQLDIRREELERSYKRETASWDLELEQIPPRPRDWERWVDHVAIPEHFVFYDYKKGGAKRGYCTYCGREVPIAGRPLHNHKGVCSCCHRPITFKALGRVGHFHTKDYCAHLLQQCRDGLVLREFWVRRSYDRDTYRTVDLSCFEDQRFLYLRENGLKCHRYYWGEYRDKSYRWIAGVPPRLYGYHYWYGRPDGGQGRVYGRTLASLARGELRQTGLVDWIRAKKMVADPRRYLALWDKLPRFEQIWKAGLTKLEEECWKTLDSVRRRVKAPQERELTRALGLDKQQFGRFRAANGDCNYLDWLHWETELGKPISDEMIGWFTLRNIQADELRFIRDRMKPVQIYNYLHRQALEICMEARQVLTTWKDYLSMAEQLGLDTHDEIIYRARLLQQRHDELVIQMHQKDAAEAAREVLETFPHVDAICRSIKEKYAYTGETYSIVVPDGVQDIITEGRVLSHCVDAKKRYWDRIQRHESYILFLRRTESPHLPYYTLEVEPDGTIRQKRTKFNRQEADIEEATTFLLEWQKVVAGRLTQQDRKRSQKSRVLREKEFAQMRKDHVVISTGDLAGQSLAEVLMADLMENAA